MHVPSSHNSLLFVLVLVIISHELFSAIMNVHACSIRKCDMEKN